MSYETGKPRFWPGDRSERTLMLCIDAEALTFPSLDLLDSHPSFQLGSPLLPCRPCSGTAGGKAQWARSICRLPTSRQVSRSSVRPPTRRSPMAKRPASLLTSNVSHPFSLLPQWQLAARLFHFSAQVSIASAVASVLYNSQTRWTQKVWNRAHIRGVNPLQACLANIP